MIAVLEFAHSISFIHDVDYGAYDDGAYGDDVALDDNTMIDDAKDLY